MRGNKKTSYTRSVTDASFKREVLANPKPVLVDFWAPWCMPCHAVAPVLDKIAKKYADRIDVLKLNVDENHGAASRYGVSSIPTMKLFHNGDVVKSITGVVSKRALEAELAHYLTTNPSESR
ncbi:thioredoxin [Streptomyces sp. NPDC102437]|uniref:thioredoxin n=1 Tax=Streptomyces sp. NPDC102437 TaxID=3366175 RepID=UPI00380F9C89